MSTSTEHVPDASPQPSTSVPRRLEPGDFGLTVHAVLPPPVTGMTLCTEAVASAVEQRTVVRRYNWSCGSPKINAWFRFIKLLRALTTPIRLLLGSRPRHGVFYMPCNAGFAVLYNFLALSAARVRGYRCVLHHHYYRYVDRFERRIKLLTMVLGANDLQIVLCAKMEAQFRAIYGDNLNLAIIPSTLQLLSDDGLSSPSQEVGYTDGTFCLGHISNLQLAKGLDLVLIVFRQLRQRNRDVRLVLAGPIDSLAERQMIESAQAEFGHRFEYRGPVYGPDKEKFFNDIHAKIYPTRLDAQPLVIMEAFRHGRPVLSYARGCIPEMMPRPEWSIDVHADFVASAVQQIESWIDDRQSYIEACRLARQRCLASMDEARAALGNFVNWVCFESDSGFVRRSPAD